MAIRGWTAILTGVIASIVAMILAWRILSTITAQSLAYTDPASAIWWRSTQPDALVNLADQDLNSSGAGAAARARARGLTALTREPLAPYVLEILGRSAAKLGQDGMADALMRMAAAFSKHDFAAEVWIFTRDLTAGDPSAAMTALDMMNRAHPEANEDIASQMALLLADQKIAVAFAAELGRQPPWRPLLLSIMIRQNRNPLGMLRLFALLDQSGGLSTDELRAFLQALIANGRYEQAYLYWLKSLPPAQLAKAGLLYNGHFDYPVSNMPFDWTIVPAPGTVTDTGISDRGPSLDIGFLGESVDFKNVTHDLLLNPGQYNLTGYVRADHFQNERGLRWRIMCLEHGGDGPAGEALGTSDFVSGDLPWQSFNVAFKVPDTGCRAQRLILELPARTAIERIASGVVSYAGLELFTKR